jgi:hypothetical protein
MAVVRWINSDLLEVKSPHYECALCLGVMVEPTSGCPEGHSFCKPCYDTALEEKQECPTCRRPVDARKLVRMRPLEDIIAELPMRCEWGDEAEEGFTAAKRAKLAPAASMAVGALRKQLGERGLDSTGDAPELVARLEEGRKKNAACRWKGSVGELAAHRGECAWEPVKCPYEGCTESPLRKDVLEHEMTCGTCEVQCGHAGCEKELERRSLAEHEGRCLRAEIKCPNEGCRETERRGWMIEHRMECAHEEIPCPGSRGSHSYKCDARFLRKDINAHIRADHLWKHQPAEYLVRKLWEENANEKAAADSELRHAAHEPPPTHPPPPTDPRVTLLVFNWRAFWEPGVYMSPEVQGVGEGWDGKMDPQTQTPNPPLSTLNPQTSTLNPEPGTLNPEPKARNPKK